MRKPICAGLVLCALLATATLHAQAPATPDALQRMAIQTMPHQSRSFVLANRTGTYFYGATGDGWDAGWMGLWVKRKRVLDRLVMLDSKGAARNTDEARCLVTPADVTWSFPDGAEVTLFFAGARDTLYYRSSGGLRIEGGPWIRESRETAAPPLRVQLLKELDAAAFSCADTNYTRAVAWAHVHLLFMLAEQDSLLYAGIPWFNEGWGRDTFISLPGLLVTGHADIALKLLMRFAGWIDRDSASATFGRVPNRVRPGEDIAYNTADGTPWWILGLYQYSLYGRDNEPWVRLFEPGQALSAALEGAMARSDSSGFLKHGDADTWMDAVGPAGAVTPRGDRAVEIQALQYAVYDAVEQMLPEATLPPPLALKASAMKRKLARDFLAGYLTPKADALCDRLKSDGSPDTLIRPNMVFAASIPRTPLLPPTVQSAMLKRVCAELVHDYGVLSLSPRERNLFHPFHMDEHYPKDDAYHNGVVWTWLSGPVKSALAKEGRTDLAHKLAAYEATLMLTRGCAGSLPELLDGMPRKGQAEPALSGTVSQTWSLAEFLRTTYQDFLGVRPVQVRAGRAPFWMIDPRIPQSWGRTQATVSMNGSLVELTAQNFGDSVSVDLRPLHKPVMPIGIKVFDADNGVTGFLDSAATVRVVWKRADSTAYSDGYPTAKLLPRGWPYEAGNPELRFAAPIKDLNFAALAPPPWDVLTDAQVFPKPNNPKTLAEAMDDSTEQPLYTYPLDEHFAPGILDITRFKVEDAGKFYRFTLTFRNLTQPGWHPEYGFQLTYAAICLQTPKGTRREVGANSLHTLNDLPAERIIYVGGGVAVEDAAGKRIAAYTPRAGSPLLGSTATKTVSFSLPKKLFPARSDSWKWTVLVGAQDDHGGAGMGEFRTVKAEAEAWAGGGNPRDGSNVYDILSIP